MCQILVGYNQKYAFSKAQPTFRPGVARVHPHPSAPKEGADRAAGGGARPPGERRQLPSQDGGKAYQLSSYIFTARFISASRGRLAWATARRFSCVAGRSSNGLNPAHSFMTF